MNWVINAQRYGKGWRVEAVTPSGRPIVVFLFGGHGARKEVGLDAAGARE